MARKILITGAGSGFGLGASLGIARNGHEVIAVQYGLESFEEDVAMVKRTLNRVGSPVILVGHSYGGATITASGVDDRVAGLVYIGAGSNQIADLSGLSGMLATASS